MRQAAAGGMMRGPKGGMYRVVNGKKVYGKKHISDHDREAKAGSHTVHTASGRILRGVSSAETASYHKTMGTTDHPQYRAIAAHNTTPAAMKGHAESGFKKVAAGGSASAHVYDLSNLGYRGGDHYAMFDHHMDAAEKHPRDSAEHKAHRALASAHLKAYKS